MLLKPISFGEESIGYYRLIRVFSASLLNRLIFSFSCGSLVPLQALAQQPAESLPPAQAANQPLIPGSAPPVQPAIIPFAVEPAPSIVPFALPPSLPDLESPPTPVVPIAIPSSPGYSIDGVDFSADDASSANGPPDDSQPSGSSLFVPNPWQSASAFGVSGSPGLSSSSGFEGGWVPYGTMLGESLRDGLGLGVSLTGTYDSNPSRGYGSAQDSGQGDFYMTLGGALSYQSKASTVNYSLNYSGGYNQYFSQSDLSGYNQSAGAGITYDRGPLSAGLRAGIDFGSGANRYYASVVDQVSYSFGLDARYRISPKTSLTANTSQRFTTSSGDGQDTSSFDFGASALWRYSELTEFGPGIRYTSRSGDSGGNRTSIGPTLTLNYQLTRKVSFNSRIGTDFAQYENGGSADPTLSASIGLNWRASSLWGMNLSLNRDAQASYTAAGQFEEMTALRLGYNRRIRRAILNLGLGMETRTPEDRRAAVAGQTDRDHLTLDTSLGMPVFANTTSATLFMRYSDQNGGAEETWDSFQIGFGLSRSF